MQQDKKCIINKNIYSKRSYNLQLGAVSNTAYNFTNKGKKKPLKPRVTIALDWFSCMVTHILDIDVLKKRVNHQDGVYLEYQKRGGGQFDNLFYIYIDGEHVGQLLTSPRSLKILKSNMAKLELQNWIFYTDLYVDYLKMILSAYDLKLNNLSRIDIAVDNVNYLHGFLNRYAKQRTMKNAKYIMVNRARFSAGVMGKDFTFNHFKVGAGRKQLTVYEKNQEINTHSLHKRYIIDFWRKNGIKADYKDKVWRAEMRLGSEALKEIKDLDLNLEKLANSDFLFSIYFTCIEKWFEFRERVTQNDDNITRMKKINLFPIDRSIELLEKIPRKRIDGHYKARMAIHQLVKDIVMNKVEELEHYEAAISTIYRFISEFDLREYYDRKLDEWIAEYRKMTSNAQSEEYLKQILTA